jgi:hypothetical protein
MLNAFTKWFAEFSFRSHRAEFYDDLADAIKARQSFDFFLKMRLSLRQKSRATLKMA